MAPVGRSCTCIADCLRKLEGVALRDLLQRSPLPQVLILAMVGNCLGRGIHYPFRQSVCTSISEIIMHFEYTSVYKACPGSS